MNSDTTYNRWLVYLVNPKEILKYMSFELAHLPLIQTSNEIYTVDIDKNHNYHNVKKVEWTNIPPDYLPDEDILFDIEDCKEDNKIKQYLINLIQKQDSVYANIYH